MVVPPSRRPDSSAPAEARFGEFLPLSEAERSALRALFGPIQHCPRQHVLRREGEAPTHLYLLVDGWVASSISLASGEQQIVKIHLPRDLMGTPSLCLRTAAENLTAITPIAIQAISRSQLMKVFARHPRIATSLFLSAQKERVALMESMAVLGRAETDVRVAAMLTNLFDRLTVLGLTTAGGFQMPLTQREIGDMVGATTQHVNRTLRDMDRAGLIQRSDQTIMLLDVDRLRKLGGLPHREFEYEAEWMGLAEAGR